MMLVIVALLVAVGIVWLITRRPHRSRHANGWPSGPSESDHRLPEAPRGPDDDPEFLRELDRREPGD